VIGTTTARSGKTSTWVGLRSRLAGTKHDPTLPYTSRAALDVSFAEASGKYFDNDSVRFTSPNVAALNAGHAKAVMQTQGEIIASALWLRRILQAPLQRLELLG
jgi:hypothetical protein